MHNGDARGSLLRLSYGAARRFRSEHHCSTCNANLTFASELPGGGQQVLQHPRRLGLLVLYIYRGKNQPSRCWLFGLSSPPSDSLDFRDQCKLSGASSNCRRRFLHFKGGSRFIHCHTHLLRVVLECAKSLVHHINIVPLLQSRGWLAGAVMGALVKPGRAGRWRSWATLYRYGGERQPRCFSGELLRTAVE